MRTNPCSSTSTSPPSQPVHGVMPMKTNSARALTVHRVPVRWSVTVTASSAASPCSSRTSAPVMTCTFAIRVTWSMR